MKGDVFNECKYKGDYYLKTEYGQKYDSRAMIPLVCVVFL